MASLRSLFWDRVVPAGMWLLLPLAPFAAAYLARDREYVRNYASALRRSAAHVRAQSRAKVGSRFVAARADRGKAPRYAISGGCTHCGQCCLYKSCIFLAFDRGGRSRCRIYGTRFWNWLRCGEYPETAMDIALYECPSFVATPVGGERGRGVIPIRRIRETA
jgi:hypothetical protein